jgi:hypothetical protein
MRGVNCKIKVDYFDLWFDCSISAGLIAGTKLKKGGMESHGRKHAHSWIFNFPDSWFNKF